MVVFLVGSVCCAISDSLLTFVALALPAGHGRRDDDAGRAARPRPRDAAQPAGRGDGVALDPRPRRPDHRAAGRRLHHHLLLVALDLPHQRADRAHRPRAGRRSSCPTSTATGRGRWISSASFSPARRLPAGCSASRCVTMPALPVWVGFASLIVGTLAGVALPLPLPADRVSAARPAGCSACRCSARR